MDFFTNAIDVLQTLVIALGGGLCVWGGITGCALGLPLHRVLYDFLIARRFPYAVWRLPAGPLALILCFVIAAALLAACAPSRRICRMPVAETINEL